MALSERPTVRIYGLPPAIFSSEATQKLYITSGLKEVGFFLEILGNPKISELKNSIWEIIGKSLGDLGSADRFFRLILVKFFDHTT